MNTHSVTRCAAVRLTLALLALLALGGCATMNKQDCLEGNWHQAGFKDALNGNTSNRLARHTKACAKHGVPANDPVYLTGYQSGLQNYCVAENGIGLGYRNRDYKGICPADTETEFLEHYIRGLLMARSNLTHHYWDVDDALNNARFRRMRLTDKKSRAYIDRRISNLANKRDDLRHERFSINRKIQHWRTHLKTTNS